MAMCIPELYCVIYFHTKSDTKSDDVGYRVWYRIWYMKLFGCCKSIQELVQLIYRRFRRDEGQLTNCTVAWRNLPPNHCGWSRFLELLKLALRTQPRSLQLHCSSLNRISQGKEIKESVAKRVIVIRRGRFSWHHVPSCHAHSWCLHVLLCFEWPGWKEIDVLCLSLFHRRWLNSYPGKGIDYMIEIIWNCMKLLWWGKVSKYVDSFDLMSRTHHDVGLFCLFRNVRKDSIKDT